MEVQEKYAFRERVDHLEQSDHALMKILITPVTAEAAKSAQ
jgi:hypothetical protein